MDTAQCSFMGKPRWEIEKENMFREWVRNYSDLLYNHTLMRGFDQDSGKDLVQETFISAWKNMDGFEGKASVKNWLFVILKNKITDHFRTISAHPKTMIAENDYQFDDSGHWAKGFYPKELTVDPTDSSEQAEFQQILEGCTQKLNTLQKTVFFMKYIDDLTSDDICVQLSITSNNYWTTLHRAKVQLRACLEKNWFLIKNI